MNYGEGEHNSVHNMSDDPQMYVISSLLLMLTVTTWAHLCLAPSNMLQIRETISMASTSQRQTESQRKCFCKLWMLPSPTNFSR